jgi:hypothetical protein
MVFWFEVPRETRRTKKAKILEHGGNEETEGKNAEATVAFGAFRSGDHPIFSPRLRRFRGEICLFRSVLSVLISGKGFAFLRVSVSPW